MFCVEFGVKFGIWDLFVYLFYFKVYCDYYEFWEQYGEVSNLFSLVFFYGLKLNEEIMVEIGFGKSIFIKYFNSMVVDDLGFCLVFFILNG